MLLNFFFSTKSTIEAAEKFTEALVANLRANGISASVKCAGKYSSTIFCYGNVNGIVEIIRPRITFAGFVAGECNTEINFLETSISSNAVKQLADAYAIRGKTAFG